MTVPAAPLSKSSTGTAFARLLIVVLGMLLTWISIHAAQHPPSFDGAMNLQVAYSLAEGEGYRRTYADREPFPREIQTNAPFTVPAALVFTLFGIGKWQSQAVNLLYLAGLALVCVALLRKRHSLLAGALCAFVVLLTPGILDSGLHGYGEIPGLFWMLLSGLVYPWKHPSATRIALAGVFLGLAVATKTVLLIGFAAFGFCYVIALACDSERSIPVRLRNLAVLAFASVFPLALFELWRLLSLGGMEVYKTWWSVELNAIGKQAGTSPGYQDTATHLEKLGVHLSLLSEMLGMPRGMLVAWIALPPAVALAWTCVTRSWRQNGLLLCLVLSASIYFAWWLLVTPTQKAWHRRILDGSLLLNIAWIYLGAIFVEQAWERWRPTRARLAGFLMVAVATIFGLALASSDIRPKLMAGPASGEHLDAAIRTLRSLPPDAQIYAVGWSSSPVLSLLSERPFLDFNDTVLSDIRPGAQTYLALDSPALSLRKQDPIISIYPAKPLLPADGTAQVYELDLRSPGLRELPPDLTTSFGGAVVAMDAPSSMIRGFYRANGDGHRWMTSRGLIGMTYDGNDFLSAILYAPGPGKYADEGGVSLAAKIDGCELGDIPLEKGGLRVAQFRIPHSCQLEAGRKVVVELSSSNLLESTITRDERALSVLVSVVGFTVGCDDVPSCDSEMAAMTRPEQQAAPASSVRQSNSPLRADPDHIDLCQNPDGLVAVSIDWVIPRGNSGDSWHIWVSAPGHARTLWRSGTAPKGRESTGPWVRDKSTFELETSSGERLDAITVLARPCRG